MMVRRYADAERAGRRALALDPDNVTAQVWLSYAILSRTGDPARALTVLRGSHPFVEMKRAALLWWQRRYADSISTVESVPDTQATFGGRGAESQAVLLRPHYLAKGDFPQHGR